MIDLGTIKQGERGTLAITWEFPDSLTAPASIVGATITAVARNMDTGDVTAISGTLTATAAAAATWALSDGDSGTAGTYLVTFRADVSGTPTYTLNGVLVVEENPAVTAVQNGALVGLSSAEAAWVTAGKTAVPDAADLVDANDLGSAAYAATGDFDAAGSAAAAQAGAIAVSLQKSSNLSDVTSKPTVRANLQIDKLVSHYEALVRARNGSSLIGFWPGYYNQKDRSYLGNNGTAQKLTSGLAGNIIGSTFYNGVTGYLNIQPGTAALFSGAAGSVNFWYRPVNAAVLTNTSWSGRLLYIYVDANNIVTFQKLTSANLFYAQYKAGGTSKDVFPSISTNGDIMITLTWSKAANEFKVYVNGSQSGSTSTGLGTWAGVPSIMAIGGGNSGSYWWNGWMHSFELHNAVLSQADITARYGMAETFTLPTYRHLVCVGDSITYGTGATSSYGWTELLRDSLIATQPLYLLSNWGVGGRKAGDAVSLANQSTHISAEIITVMFGANDQTAQTALATFNTNVTTLVSNFKTRCNQLLLINIPPNTIGGAITRAQYNAEIAAVAAAQSVTLVDVSNAYATGTHTTDGVHPNDAGHAVLAGLVEAAL